MLSGVLTNDSLTQAFRALSQKRRHGVLDIASPQGRYLVYFYSGKIVGAVASEEPFVPMICKRLANAEIISEDLCRTLQESVSDLTELHEVLVGRNIISEEQFQRAKRTYEMDVLYGLRRLHGGVFKFTSKIVDVDDALALSIAPGQLLLDMVELDAAEHRLENDLQASLNSDICVVPQASQAPHLSNEEAEVWRTLEVTHCVREIRDRAMLSEYQLTEALLGLLERRLIAPSSEQSRPVEKKNGANPLHHLLADDEKPAAEPPTERARSQFNALIDEAASLLESGLDELNFGNDDVGGTHDELAPKSEEDQPESESDELIRAAVSSLDDGSDESWCSQAGNLEVVDEQASDQPGAIDVTLTAVAATDGEAVGSIPTEPLSLRAVVSLSSVRLLDEEILGRLTLAMTIMFLLALGWLGPRMIDRWFSATELFSSIN